MTDANKIKAVIILYSLIIFLTSFVTGESIDDNLFRWISGATSIVVLSFLLYEKWIWKWPVFKKVSEFYGVPVIHGTWKGKLHYKRDAAGKNSETDIYISIHQTLFSVKVDSFVSTSESYSVIAKIEDSPSNRKQIIYFYRSAAPYGKRDNNRPHDGSCVLNIIGSPVKKLSGSYFTERNGAGEVKLEEYYPQNSESFEEAEKQEYTILPHS